MNVTTPSPETFSDELDLRAYVAPLLRWWRLILLCAGLGAAIAFVFTFLSPRLYGAEADVAIVRSSTIVNFESKIRSVSDTDLTVQLDQIARRKSLITIAQSGDVARLVIERIGAQLPTELRDPANLSRSMKVTLDGDLVRIQVISASPELAASIANAWAESYEARANEIYSEYPFSAESIMLQAQQAKNDYATKQQALTTFLSSNSIEQLARRQSLLKNQLDNQVAVESKLIQLEQEAQALRTRIMSGESNSSSGDELASLLLEASAFSNGAGLPVNLQIALGTETTGATPAEQARRLDSLVTSLQTRRTALTADLREPLHKELGSVQGQLEEAQANQRELVAARELAWNTFQSLETKLAEATISADAKNQIVRVAIPATLSTVAMPSRGPINTLLGAVVGLLIGVALAFGMEYWIGGLPDAEHATTVLSLPTLATLPSWGEGDGVGNLPPAALEALRGLRYQLLNDQPSQVVMLTSANGGEGASNVAANLAIITAQGGKRVLLLDANLREPILHQPLQLEAAPGLAELLRGATRETIPWLKFTQTPSIDNLTVISAGECAADPAALLETHRLARLFAQFKDAFDVVIVNAPPVLGLIDAVEIASVVDTVVLVLDSSHTTRAAAVRANRILSENRVVVRGIVLNQSNRTFAHHVASSAKPKSPSTPKQDSTLWSTLRVRLLQWVGPRTS